MISNKLQIGQLVFCRDIPNDNKRLGYFGMVNILSRDGGIILAYFDYDKCLVKRRWVANHRESFDEVIMSPSGSPVIFESLGESPPFKPAGKDEYPFHTFPCFDSGREDKPLAIESPFFTEWFALVSSTDEAIELRKVLIDIFIFNERIVWVNLGG
jgi:hypothetical protein